MVFVFQIIAIQLGVGWHLTAAFIFIPLVFCVMLMCFHVLFGCLYVLLWGYTQCIHFYIRIFHFYCEIIWVLAICLFCIQQTHWGHYDNVEDSGEPAFSVARVTTCSSLAKATMIYAVALLQLLAAAFYTFRPVGGQTILPLFPEPSWLPLVCYLTSTLHSCNLAALMRLLNYIQTDCSLTSRSW